MMGLFRRASVLAAGMAVCATAVSLPAEGSPDPTTVAIEGTVKVVVVETFGAHAHDEHLYSVVTDDGASIPVDLDDDVPANAHFDGELVVDGGVEAALDDRGLLPDQGATIAQDTRAGRVAVAAAQDEQAPLTVAASTVTPAAAISQAAVASAHRAYVVKMTDQGSVDGSNTQIETKVDEMLKYWTDESGGAITSFARQGAIRDFDSSANIPTSQSCGMNDPDLIWNDARTLFPGVDIYAPGNHLIVLVGDECGTSGPVGVATIGSSLASGGPSMLTYDAETFASTGAHELGHNFGLEHANLQTCPRSDICEYYDLYSPMALSVAGGGFGPPALGTLYRTELGLTSPSEVATVTAGQGAASQTFTLAPRSATSGLRGVRVTDPVTGTTYSVDWRSHTARDASTFYGSSSAFGTPRPVYPSGVVIETQDGAEDTYLVTRSGAGGRQTGSFAAGTSFTPSSGLTVTVTSIGATAGITVQLNGAAAPPTTTPPVTTPPVTEAPPVTSPPSYQPASLSAGAPAISGTAKVGRTLKVRLGSWAPWPSFRYQWFANGKKIASKGAGSSFKVTAKQKGKRITVQVTGWMTGYATVTKVSAATKKVSKKK